MAGANFRRMAVLACAVLLAGAWPLAVGADHLQGSGPALSFDHRGGNEWWVEVAMGGSDALRVSRVEASDSGGPWVALEKKSWGTWAASFHIEPHHEVRFRATLPEGLMGSCWFFHPSGFEDCSLVADTMPARFTVSGNADLIEVGVAAPQAVTDVDAIMMMPSGSWNGPDLSQWTDGVWRNGDVHVPAGTVLAFLARGSGTDAHAFSDCYRWPTAAPVPCPVLNGGWMEDVFRYEEGTISAVAVYRDVQKVEVRFDGGTFQPMAYHPNAYPPFTYGGAPATGKHIAEFRVTTLLGTQCDERGYWYPEEWPPYVGWNGDVVFADVKGGTNWVQVNPYTDEDLAGVEVQVNGGAWQALAFQPYCDWAAPVHVPAGSTLRFRAYTPDLVPHDSAPMAWPPGGGGAFDATFTGVRGNEWWVQANVATAGGTLSKVDVSLNGGAWQPLAKQSWGGWAASYRIVQGTVVQMRATSTTGATDLSSCRQWIPPSGQDAQIVPCGSTPPPPPAFDATFTGVKGNEWWVQANVAANQPLAGVDARVNCGTWVALTLQNWGGWAKSFHVPSGSKVDFRARSTSGATDLSGGYVWPNATPTGGC